MQYLRIQIGNELVDFEVTPQKFFVSYSIKSLEDFSKVGGALTEKSLIIPCTKQNNFIFNKYWDINGDNVEASNFKDISISDGGIYSFTGKCLLKGVDLYGTQYGYTGGVYRLACFGDNSNFIIDIENKLMRDLSDLPAPINYTFANVVDGFSPFSGASIDWVFSIIKCGNWKTPGEVSAFETTPGLRIEPLIKNIFKDLGYTVVSTWLELDQTKRLFLPLIPFNRADEIEGYPEAIANIRAVNTTTTTITNPVQTLLFDTQTIAPTLAANPYNLATGEFTAPFTGFYNLKTVVELTNFNPVSDDFAIAFYNTTTGGPEIGSATGDPLSATDVIRLEIDIVTQLTAGDVVILRFVSLNIDADVTPLSLDILTEAQFGEGVPILFDLLLRDYKQKDFITGIQELFGLNIQVNSANRTAIIEPADAYINASGTNEIGFYTGVDSSKQIDLNGTHRLTNTSARLNKDIAYKFKVNDDTSAAIDAGQLIGFNDGLYRFIGNRFKNGVTIKENSFFHKQPEIIDNEVRADESQSAVQFPLIWPSNYFENPGAVWVWPDPVLRILFHAGFASASKINMPEAIVTNQTINPPLCFMVEATPNSIDTINLSYSDVERNSVSRPGLLKYFFLNELKRIQTGKLLQTWLSWRGLDIANLTFRPKIILDGSAYILQSIKNYDPLSNAATKTVLLFDSPVEEKDDQSIQINNNLGIIVTE